MVNSPKTARPRERATRWCVLTGAPCSGKTTVIDALKHLGFTVVPEMARTYIENELKKGKTIETIRRNALAFQRHILYTKVYIENSLSPQDLIFLDRGIPDSIAYFRLSNLPAEEPLYFSEKSRYDAVFLFERLPLSPDPVRSEDDATTIRIQELIRNAYGNLGYTLAKVPVMPVAERVRFILDRLPATR